MNASAELPEMRWGSRGRDTLGLAAWRRGRKLHKAEKPLWLLLRTMLSDLPPLCP